MDFDPLVNVMVTVKIDSFRALDSFDLFSESNFFVIVVINDVVFRSPVWENTSSVYDCNWSATLDVPDDVENVSVVIQLWDRTPCGDKPCDICGDPLGMTRT